MSRYSRVFAALVRTRVCSSWRSGYFAAGAMSALIAAFLLIAYTHLSVYKEKHAFHQTRIQKPPDLVLFERLGVFEKMSDKNDRLKFGYLLLDDTHGKKMSVINANNRDNVRNINRAICSLWLQGRGKRPVTWRTFIDVLYETRLLTLGDDIFQQIETAYLDVVYSPIDSDVPLINEPPNLKIIEKYGILDLVNDYSSLEILLLEDKFGVKINKNFNTDVKDIAREICLKWLHGKGKQPVTWRTFIDTLNDIGLKLAASDLFNIVDTNVIDDVADHIGHLGLEVIREPPNLVWFEKVEIFDRIPDSDFNKLGVLLLDDKFGKKTNEITNKDGQSIKEICKQWLLGNGRQPVTWRTFIDVVNTTQLQVANELTKLIDTDYLDVNSTFTHPSIVRCSKSLKEYYSHQALFDFNPTDLIFLDVSLRYAIVKEYIYHNNTVNIREVMNEIQYSDMILITGQPGAGKTTLLRYLAKMWALESILQPCQILFYLTLSDAGILDSLVSLLRQSESSLTDIETIAEEIEIRRGMGTCFLLDSYEWHHHQDYVYQLLQGNKLYNSLRIITTRPNKMSTRYIAFKKNLEIVGFKQSDLPQYLNVVSNNETVNKAVSTLWKSQPNVQELCTLPLLFSMVLSIAKESNNESPLQTRSQIYTTFMLKTIFQYQTDDRPYYFLHQCLGLIGSESYHQMCAAFCLLLDVAFDMTFNGQCTFPDVESNEVLQELKTMGFVDSELTVHMNRRKFTFSHSTFREYLAALKLAVLPKETQLYYATLYNHAWYSAFQFFFGLPSALEFINSLDISSILQRISVHFSWPVADLCTFQFSIQLLEMVQESQLPHKDIISTVSEESCLCVYSDTYKHHILFDDRSVRYLHFSESTTGSFISLENWVHYDDDLLQLWWCLNSAFNEGDGCKTFSRVSSFRFIVTDVHDYERLSHMLHAFTNLQHIYLEILPTSYDDQLSNMLKRHCCVDDLTLSALSLKHHDKLPCVKRLTLISESDVHVNFTSDEQYGDGAYSYLQSLSNHFMWAFSAVQHHLDSSLARSHNCSCEITPLISILEEPDKLEHIKMKGLQSINGCSKHVDLQLFLKNLTGIKHLHIIDVNVRESNFSTLLRIGTLTSNILTLEVSHIHITHDEAKKIIQNLPLNLQNLLMNDIIPSKYNISELSESLAKLADLHSLTLSRSYNNQ